MKVLIAGDYCADERVAELVDRDDFSTLFDKVKSIIEQYDFSIVNFEFPVVLSNPTPISKIGPNLWGSKKSVDAIKYAGFNVCTLANNHILDQGEQCCIDTINLLHDAGIKTAGAGENLHAAENILYLHGEGMTLAVVNCCEHEYSYGIKSRSKSVKSCASVLLK